MQEPTKYEKFEYIAEMAEELARLCQQETPTTAELLRLAAKLAREREGPTR